MGRWLVGDPRVPGTSQAGRKLSLADRLLPLPERAPRGPRSTPRPRHRAPREPEVNRLGRCRRATLCGRPGSCRFRLARRRARSRRHRATSPPRARLCRRWPHGTEDRTGRRTPPGLRLSPALDRRRRAAGRPCPRRRRAQRPPAMPALACPGRRRGSSCSRRRRAAPDRHRPTGRPGRRWRRPGRRAEEPVPTPGRRCPCRDGVARCRRFEAPPESLLRSRRSGAVQTRRRSWLRRLPIAARASPAFHRRQGLVRAGVGVSTVMSALTGSRGRGGRLRRPRL